jgi:hypothetical protein
MPWLIILLRRLASVGRLEEVEGRRVVIEPARLSREDFWHVGFVSDGQVCYLKFMAEIIREL